jgi:hypothetical protein
METIMQTVQKKRLILLLILILGVATAVLLTGTALARPMQAPAAPSALPAPVGYWRMEQIGFDPAFENSVMQLFDANINGDAAQVTDAPDNNVGFFTFPVISDDTNEQNAQSVQLDGTGDYLQVDQVNAPALTSQMTLAVWVKLTNPTADQKILGRLKLNGSDRSGFVLGVSGGSIIGEVYDAAGTGHAVIGGAVTAGAWTHLAVTWQSGDKFTAYVNGTQVGQVNASAQNVGADCDVTFGGCNLIFGGAPWAPTASNVNGNLDEILIFDQSLAADQIAELAQRTFIVNTSNNDVSTCDAAACNLQSAITVANGADNGALPDRIRFSIPNGSVIQPVTALPTISEAVQIDGGTGETCTANKGITLDGIGLSRNSNVNGLYLGPGADGSFIAGLGIINFPTAGIYINSDGNRIACSVIGIDQQNADAGNQYGIMIVGSGNLIGSEVSGPYTNFVAGNDQSGIQIFQFSTVPTGNTIGYNAIGLAGPSNIITNRIGIFLSTGVQNTTVISNFIEASSAQGILAMNTAVSNNSIIDGNWIGNFYSSGFGPQSNGAQGIHLLNAPGYRITKNWIQANGGDGIAVDGTSSGVFILDNVIVANGGLGIDLGSDGPTPNDLRDGDIGPNNLQNYPTINTAIADGETITVTGSLQSQPNGLYALSFYHAPPTGSCQGASPLDIRVERQADANGTINFTATSPYAAYWANGEYRITALAIDLNTNDTSEFAPCLSIIGPQVYLPLVIKP